MDPFLCEVDMQNLAATEFANELRERGDDEQARQVEIAEAERTVRALEGLGLEI